MSLNATGDLEQGTIELLGLLPAASNYTLLARLVVPEMEKATLVVYKPRRGEAPLWDFPSGTLCHREVAAHLVAEAAGWGFVPPTVLREGPLGPGAVQSFIDHDFSCAAFDLLPDRSSDLMSIALFDLVVNNADRKAGHVFEDSSGRVWAVDHGICFHVEPKLRTVLWDFAGLRIPGPDLAALKCLHAALDVGLADRLQGFLSRAEIEALRARAQRFASAEVFPAPGPRRSYPWPPI